MSRDIRLLTLMGPGGIGKTRLALEIAATLANRFADGRYFVDLAPIASPDMVLGTVASALGLHDGASPVTLVAALQDRDLLLILDNCEHLVDACASICQVVLKGTSGVRVLATSRAALGIAGEVRRPISPLAIPPEHTPEHVDDLTQYASVRLFVERALDVQPDFKLTQRSAYALIGICRRLDGIPLALELAAARATILSIEEIASRLDDRWRLLHTGARSAAPRHRALRATLDWSYELLQPRERQTFSRLAVFAGGCTLEATEYVVTFDEVRSEEVLESVAMLADHSLVTVIDAGGKTRYGLLETLRQYAWDRLAESGTMDEVRNRHLAWCLELAAKADPERSGATEEPGFRQLSAEHDNMRAALAWGLERRPAAALRLAGYLADFWRRSGHHTEGRRALAQVLALPAVADDDADARARVLLGAGQLAADVGQFTPTELARAEQCVDLFRAAGNEKRLVDALQHLGRCVVETGGSVDRAQQLFDESLRIAERREDLHGIGFALANSAYLTWTRGQRERALQQYVESIRYTRASGDMLFTGLLLGLLGWSFFEQGDLFAARRTKEESLEILRALHADEAVGLALLGLAHIERAATNAERLYTCLEESVALLQTTGSPGLSDCLTFVGAMLVESGEYAMGVRLLSAGESEGPRYGSIRYLLYQTPRGAADASLETARCALGEPAYSSAWATGKELPLHAAVTGALRTLREVRANQRATV